MNYREEKLFKERDYAVETTQDMSPTLRPQQKESMHHMGGAAGESVYLYYEALVRYSQIKPIESEMDSLSVLSFGFGMGYNELLTVLFFLKNKLDLTKLCLVSHEKDLFLYDLFNEWLKADGKEPSIFDQVFEGIERTGINAGSAADAKKGLVDLLQHNRWLQLGPVLSVDEFKNKYDIVFYDAFSSKTNDFLWDEFFLDSFFKNHLNAVFVFSTYACTGNLKRVAAGNRSQFEKRDGFKGKRNSSLIRRS